MARACRQSVKMPKKRVYLVEIGPIWRTKRLICQTK
jgi:hypothetical protein